MLKLFLTKMRGGNYFITFYKEIENYFNLLILRIFSYCMVFRKSFYFMLFWKLFILLSYFLIAKILVIDLWRASPSSKFCLNSSKMKREVRYQNFAWIQVKYDIKILLDSSKIKREVRYQRGSLISKWGSPISKFCLNSSKNDMGWIQTSNYSKI